MSDSTFYSDRIGRGVPRVSEEVSPNAWKGVVALIHARIRDGSLARDFAQNNCRDEPAVITGTDDAMLLDSLEAHVPGFHRAALDERYPPDTSTSLDIIDFVALHVDQPFRRKSHDYFNHEHLYFSQEQSNLWLSPGQVQFRSDIDLLFARNGIAFTLGDDMRVRRIGPPEARQLISDFKPYTGDSQLDSKLIDATSRFLSRTPGDRLDALEKLWDAFERLKTLELGGQVKNSVTQLLERAAPEPFRAILEAEFKILTDIGNNFTIRHHAHPQQALPSDAVVDYLFIRLLSIIALVLRETGRMRQ
jgi:hypothetical protein